MPESTSQIDLFGVASPEPDVVQPAVPSPELQALAAGAPRGLRLGTSSWSFPGWAGLVWARRVGEQLLARDGLAAYARHPLLRAAGVDRTFWSPLPPAEFRRYAEAVPEDFRFVVKAHAPLTTPADSYTRRASRVEIERFLDAAYASERVVAPAVEGLGAKLGAILFQFPPLSYPWTRDTRLFSDTLERFLGGLPRGPHYVVELRNEELLTPGYLEALARHGATHCYNVHPRMSTLVQQSEALAEWPWPAGRPVILRWMLHPAQEYEPARERYFPFDRLVDPDPGTRGQVADLVEQLLGRGHEVVLIANNKAEGSAPLTLAALVRELQRRREAALGPKLPPAGLMKRL